VEITRTEVEDFLYLEAQLMDEWKLKEWSELFTDNGTYVIPTLGKPNIDSKKTLYLVDDDKFRLTARAERLLKREAHVEYPHSTTCHNITNVRIEEIKDQVVYVRCNFVAYRTKREVLDYFVGYNKYKLIKDNENNLKIMEKKVILTLDALRPQGKISILL
jgi:p-cumate 2,3-dioxygenase subunit beta